MQSLIILSKDKEQTIEFVHTFCKKENIDPIDADFYSFEKAMGIDDVRILQKKLFLKPIRSTTKAAILDAPYGITIEAQNALLKTLEEPPKNTVIILRLTQKEIALPTILSRCKIVQSKKALKIPHGEVSQYLRTLMSFSQSRVGDKLKLALDLAKNEKDILFWLEKMVLVVRSELISKIKSSDPKVSLYLNILASLQKTYGLLKSTTVNKRFALENLFLSLS